MSALTSNRIPNSPVVRLISTDDIILSTSVFNPIFFDVVPQQFNGSQVLPITNNDLNIPVVIPQFISLPLGEYRVSILATYSHSALDGIYLTQMNVEGKNIIFSSNPDSDRSSEGLDFDFPTPPKEVSFKNISVRDNHDTFYNKVGVFAAQTTDGTNISSGLVANGTSVTWDGTNANAYYLNGDNVARFKFQISRTLQDNSIGS